MSELIGAGDFIPWDSGCALIGRAVSVTPMHSHYAIQIAFGSAHGIRFRADERDEWTEYGAAIIPSRQPHMMDSTRVPFSAVIFIEPETHVGHALTEQYLGHGIAALTGAAFVAAAPALFAVWQQHRNSNETVRTLQDVVGALTDGMRARVVSDERILRAVAYIKSHLDAHLTLEQVAGEACLSPSRFRHLFVEQTGTALRPYVLWRRFLLAWEIVMRGESLSAAAHAAGFADAAHLTRTSHRMFGFPPSALQITTHREGTGPGRGAKDSRFVQASEVDPRHPA
jgi:AraC family transcriptional regulator